MLDLEKLSAFVAQALDEDVGAGDFTSEACIDQNSTSKARLLVKDDGVVAGVKVAEYIFKHLDPQTIFTVFIEDGKDVKMGDIVFEVESNSRAILKGERLALNIMQRLSGIATISSRFAIEVEDLPVTILDTRKTSPLMRFLEKWAVEVGGCSNYREGLYDRIMIKDNHIDAAGGIRQAIEKTQAFLKEKDMSLPITIEVRNLVELYEVMEVGQIDRIMLDNFEIILLAEAVQIIGDKFESEASGGMNLRVLRRVAETGVQYISVGALTHSAGTLDLSLKVVK